MKAATIIPASSFSARTSPASQPSRSARGAEGGGGDDIRKTYSKGKLAASSFYMFRLALAPASLRRDILVDFVNFAPSSHQTCVLSETETFCTG